ncbi:MAG: methyltransferase domain-containing protein [Synergistaceae bacterium]|nr:methyltransferase domain-containing protein [Synergistaceae bacterium]
MRPNKSLKERSLFLRELIRTPGDIGALCASSPALAKMMVDAVPLWRLRGQVLELGAGTGPVTKALIDRGVPKERLVVVEKSEALALCLRNRFPGTNVLCCGAEELEQHVNRSVPVDVIVSSLPFRSLPKELTQAIMNQIASILAPRGLYIQFTYALLGEIPMVPQHFRKVRSRVVFKNIPPAKVVVFQNQRGQG